MDLHVCRDGCRGVFFLNRRDFIDHLRRFHGIANIEDASWW